jgi:glycosyltransferase involved in cell wall biosynthesis
MVTENRRPRVSIIMPCRNEAAYIGPCLDSILATDYPLDLLEVLVADGRSEDASREIIERCAARNPCVRLLDNPARITPAALNIAIRAVTGDVVIRMDAHALYPRDYIPRLVDALLESGADNVGGVLRTVPANTTPTARAIAVAFGHPLGVGNAYFRLGVAAPRWVDTVPFGCFRRDLFDRVGMFDEELIRNQDDEFNLRVIGRGGRVLLLPDVEVKYFGRRSLHNVARMFYQYGYYKPLVARKAERIMTRHLVPPLFVLSLVATAVLGIWIPTARAVLAGIVGTYATLLLTAAVFAIRKHGVRCAATLAAVFGVMHVGYGAGYLRGVIDHWSPRRRRAAPPQRASHGEALAMTSVSANSRPRVSIIMPCRNEAGYIGPCLDSILGTDYPLDLLEVLVADGRSDDGTRAIVERCAARHPCVRLLDNPAQITAAALNTAIRAATGDVIIRMDAHCVYPREYVSQLVAALRETGADNVGGVVVTLPADATPTARAIALALAHPLGVGNAYFRIGVSGRRWVDTVPFGCFRRELFNRIGMFDEELVRNEDDEFNLRLLGRGGRILLLGDVVSHYYARRSIRAVARMYYQYGYFKPLVARKAERIMTRHLVPPVFVLSLVATAIIGIWIPAGRAVLAGIVGAYAALLLTGALLAIRKHGVRCAATLAAVFGAMHVGYGAGYLRGIIEHWSPLRRRERSTPAVSLTR